MQSTLVYRVSIVKRKPESIFAGPLSDDSSFRGAAGAGSFDIAHDVLSAVLQIILNRFPESPLLVCDGDGQATMSGAADNMALTLSQDLADRESFDALVQRRSRFVFQVAYAALGQAHDAEDVVQEVFLRLYRTGAWRRMQDEAAFLARTTWRLARSRQTRSAKLFSAATEEEFLTAPALAPSPEQCAMGQQEQELLRRLVSQLPADLRGALVLSAIDGMTSAGAGEVLGIPAATVRSRVLRARQLLREKYNALAGGKR